MLKMYLFSRQICHILATYTYTDLFLSKNYVIPTMCLVYVYYYRKFCTLVISFLTYSQISSETHVMG